MSRIALLFVDGGMLQLMHDLAKPGKSCMDLLALPSNSNKVIHCYVPELRESLFLLCGHARSATKGADYAE